MVDEHLKPYMSSKIHNLWVNKFQNSEENDTLYKIYFKLLYWLYFYYSGSDTKS